jgi:predicted nucleic acid-binding protein
LSTFVDTSVWFAAVNIREARNEEAKGILAGIADPVLTDHVLVETWRLVNNKIHREAAEKFWLGIREGVSRLEKVTAADLETAWAIGTAFPDQAFSIVDRTSFAVMERLSITRAASFDADFAIYRYGRARDTAFQIVRSGHSEAFRLFHRAILERKQITCVYQGHHREICPHILGHSNGSEKALVYQFGGTTGSKLPREGQWKCFFLDRARDIALRGGRWRSGTAHTKTQRCVDLVYVDVNTNVPNQPGRR